MQTINKVTYDQLKLNYDVKKIRNKSKKTNQLFPGNKDMKDMLDMILEIKNKEHIYISTKKESKIEEFLIQFLGNRTNTSYDWAYVYNFKEPNKPAVIKIPSGEGCIFKEKIEQCVTNVLEESKKCILSKELKQAKERIKKDILEESEKEFEALKFEAEQLNFATHINEKGIFFIPIINGKKVSETEYDNLDAIEQERIIEDLSILEKMSQEVLKKVKIIKKESKIEILNLKHQILMNVLDNHFNKLLQEGSNEGPAQEFIKGIRIDLEEELEKIYIVEKSNRAELITEMINPEKEIKNKYFINLLERPKFENAPVIYANKTTYYELFGKIQFKNELGVITTDISLIQAGFLHMANGGFLILDICDLVGSKMIWDKLKKSLINKSLEFDSIREQLGALPIKTIEPESIPLDLNVILLGDENYYRALYELDDEFQKIFPYKLIFPETIDATEENIVEYSSYLENKNITDLALKRMIEYAIKMTGNKKKLTTNLVKIDQLINLSESFAQKEETKYIKAKHIKKAEEELKTNKEYYMKSLKDHILTGQIMIELAGRKVGQINGLTISTYCDENVAFPVRITATSYASKTGIISIEKDNNLSGKIFSKSVGIISSYLSSIFSKEKPLSINCSLCFEQVYSDIEGDSASCAETYAILSALSGIPIHQNIAITGSMDQLGNVQPIGAVTTKIEGFYEICKLKGLTGNQGVIIPEKNREEIILDDEIMEAIQKEKFHIYSINTIEEGIPFLMDIDFKKLRKKIIKSLKNK